jgi:glycyl-tRNA synthetase beta chain
MADHHLSIHFRELDAKLGKVRDLEQEHLIAAGSYREAFVRGHGEEAEEEFIRTKMPVAQAAAEDLFRFLFDRLGVYLRDRGARHDHIAAVLNRDDDLLLSVRRVEALSDLLSTEDGKNLLAGTKRAANILAAEEKKQTRIAEAVEPELFRTDDEPALFAAINEAERRAGEAIAAEDFAGAMRALSALRQPVDSFFDRVLVNDEDLDVRANRLALLARIRAATGQVADFSKIAG